MVERRRKHPQHRGAVRKQESCCPQTPRWPRGSESFLILMLLDSPGPGAPTSVPSVTEAKRVGISLGSARRRCFSGGSSAKADRCRVCKMGGSGHEGWGWGSPLGRRKVGSRAPRARTQDSSTPPLQPLDGATGRCRPLHPQRDRGRPEPRQRHWAKGHWSLRRTLQRSSRCLVPSGLHSVEGAGVLVLQEWAGACGGPQTPQQPLGSRKAWAGGRWGLCTPSEMVTFPAPPQHPAALDYCQGSAWPKRETSYVLAPGTHLQGRTLSAKPHPLPNLSDELPPDKLLQTFPKGLSPQALPAKLQPHVEERLLSTGHQHTGSRPRNLLGQIPVSLY